jgi:AcrR family transcriptional regulator
MTLTHESLTLRRRLSPGQVERRARVLGVAVDLAEAGGYDAVAMKDVAERSGVALATLYRWFASKDHLLTEVLLGWMADLGATLESAPPADARAADRVSAVMQLIADTVASRPRLAAAVAQALLSFDDGVWDSEHDFHSAMAGWIDVAIGAEAVANRDAIIEVLEHVCFSSLISIARGRDTPSAMGERLALTAQLLLRS